MYWWNTIEKGVHGDRTPSGGSSGTQVSLDPYEATLICDFAPIWQQGDKIRYFKWVVYSGSVTYTYVGSGCSLDDGGAPDPDGWFVHPRVQECGYSWTNSGCTTP